MSTLHLIRHGQASFDADNYDRLSELGRTQAQLLGRMWADRGIVFDAIYIGPCDRHQQTAEQVGRAYEQAGLHWPQPRSLPSFDEHCVNRALNTRLADPNGFGGEAGQLARQYAAAADRPERLRAYLRLLQHAIAGWSAGTLDLGWEESWTDFTRRVTDGLHQATRDVESANVAVFTSVGPITVALRQALGLADTNALSLGWRLHNCSVTRFVFSRDRFTLDAFNHTPHLHHDDLLTYL